MTSTMRYFRRSAPAAARRWAQAFDAAVIAERVSPLQRMGPDHGATNFGTLQRLQVVDAAIAEHVDVVLKKHRRSLDAVLEIRRAGAALEKEERRQSGQLESR